MQGLVVLSNAKELPPQQMEDWGNLRLAIVRYVRARIGRADLAEDLAQETLTRLIAVAQSQQIGSTFALAFRIADNLMADVRRSERREGEVPEQEPACDAPSLDRVLDSRRALEVMSACLQKMPPLRREVIVRRRLKEESCRAIGEDLSMSAKAVEKHITRGLVDLRRALERAGVDQARDR